jgi:hypothetical protein
MSGLDIEFFAERALRVSKDQDSADWQPLMEDIMATARHLTKSWVQMKTTTVQLKGGKPWRTQLSPCQRLQKGRGLIAYAKSFLASTAR